MANQFAKVVETLQDFWSGDQTDNYFTGWYDTWLIIKTMAADWKKKKKKKVNNDWLKLFW